MGKKKGGKTRKRAKKQSNKANRKLILKDPGQEYAQVSQMLGNGRIKAFCYDGKERMCKIRGAMVRKVWINVGDIIIVALREGLDQDKKADVIHKYFPEEVRIMKRKKELPSDKELERIKNPNKSVEESEIVFDDV